MKRKLIIASLLVLILCLVAYWFNPNRTINTLFDNNAQIAAQGDSSNYVNYSGTMDNTGNRLEVNYGDFNGKDTIWLIDVKKPGEIELNYDSVLKKGNFKTVLVTPKSEVITVFEQSKKGSYKADLKTGEYRIKIVGKNAGGYINMNLKTADFMQTERADKEDF